MALEAGSRRATEWSRRGAALVKKGTEGGKRLFNDAEGVGIRAIWT